jgi:diguanylate cyclase (GGDEF)-like protein/PAS domain S-box-containing protein
MLRAYEIICQQHDPRLELLSVLIAVFGAHTTVRLLMHAARQPAGSRRLWLAAAAVAAGSAIWATHFLDLLSFRRAGPVSYDTASTVLALVAAVFVSGAGLALAVVRPGRWVRAAGGAVLGLGIGVGHYLGMMAATLPGFLTWNATIVAVSILVGCLLCAAAAMLALDRAKTAGATLATACFALAIGVVHVAGIAAATFHPTGPVTAPPPDTISSGILAANVAFVCCVIMMLSLAALDVDRRNAQRRAAESATLRSLADIAVEGLAVCDGDRVVAVNRSFEQMTGLAASALQGMNVETLFDNVANASGMTMLLEKAGERVLISASGEPVPVEVMRKPITYEGRPHQVVALRDLRERRKAEAEIRFLAHHDALTKLSNRTAFGLALDRQLGEHARDQTPFALLGIDLDRFKAVNDTLGHPLGDKLLQRVAQRLRAAVREGDVVARIGGDEFSILLAGPVTPEDADALARRVVEMIHRPFIIDGEVVTVGASVGVALVPQDGRNVVALMKCADLALYRAKIDGGNMVRRFEPGIDVQMQERRLVELDLRRALRQDELDVFYQPLFDVRSQRVRGFEALARWRHPTRGLLLPAEFIAVAEETRLIVPLGARVLRLATRQAVAWGGDVSVAVNLSAVQFADGKLVDTVRGALRESGLDPRRLELEITETVLLRDSTATLATLHDLRDLGVRISMDDFGTGYSSLRYLRSFPFDKIKIDQSFVHEMLSNEECAAIIDAVIGIGRRLGITTTAEGVETDEQLARLCEEGCDMVQGYLIGRPMPASDAERHLAAVATNPSTTTIRELQSDVGAPPGHA